MQADRAERELTDLHFQSFGSKDIRQKGDHFRRKDLKVLELRAFDVGFLFKKKGFTLKACTDLTRSMVTVVNNTALKFAKKVGVNSPHDSQNIVTM